MGFLVKIRQLKTLTETAFLGETKGRLTNTQLQLEPTLQLPS